LVQKLKIQDILKSINEKAEEALNQDRKFDIRLSGKIDILNFILSFFAMFEENKKMTLSLWSIQLGFIINDLVSKQAISAKFYDRHLDHVESILTESLSLHIEQLNEKAVLDNELFASFGKVLVRDSVCFNLHDSLAGVFTGSGKGSTARLQTAYELKSRSYEYFKLCSYRENDQKAAGDVLPYLEKNDLVIQDLGYQSFKVYGQIINKGAFFLTAWSYGSIIMDIDSGERIDLLALLKKEGQIDRMVKLGAIDQLKVRIVAKKIAPKVAEQRKRKARKDHKKSTNHSNNYYKMLEWDIRITNVPKETWTLEKVLLAYRLRWHIEIIYKAWKSSLNMNKKAVHKMNASKCKMIFYLMLLYAVINCQVKYRYFLIKIKQRYENKDLSIVKFYNFAQEFRKYIEENLESEHLLYLVVKHCCYEKRNKRKNYEQLLYYQANTS